VAACRVSFKDPSGIQHAVDVAADSLYEAAALAVVEFRRQGLVETTIGPGTELRVRSFLAVTRHYSLTMGRLEEWARHGTCRGPKQKVYRDRIAQMLGLNIRSS
jgi:hypothetical protein